MSRSPDERRFAGQGALGGARDGGFVSRGGWRDVDGLRIFYLDEGSGTPVVLLHGIPTFSYLWRDVVPVVARDHRAIVPDLYGFGYSDKPRDRPYTVVGEADMVERLLAGLGVEQFALVGHDFGALVAAELVARDDSRITHLILTNASLRPEKWSGMPWLLMLRLPLLGELAMVLARAWMLRRAMGVYVSRTDRLTPEVMDHYWLPFRHGFKTVLLRLYRSPATTKTDFARWRAALPRLSALSLIVWGARDPNFGFGEARDPTRLIPSARLEVFDRANHFIQEDEPLALGRLIDAFLSNPIGS
jgi:pimeloyl-ACP methyl ester carboxylesterase